MSNEQLVAFGERIQSDDALQKEIAPLGKDLAGIVAVAKREGYEFTEAELVDYLRAAAAEKGIELDESDLELVVGSGGNTPTNTCLCTQITD